MLALVRRGVECFSVKEQPLPMMHNVTTMKVAKN